MTRGYPQCSVAPAYDRSEHRLRVADPEFDFAERATSATFNTALLTGGKLQVCLMQIGPALAAIAGDQSRPSAVLAVQHLLAGGGGHSAPALSEMVPGAGAVLVVTPEFAFGSGDWAAVDAAVRQSPRPLVVLAGFGATPGQALLDWQAVVAEGGATVRHFAWNQAAQGGISAVRRVNGGWCWVHDPAEGTHCVAFLKTVAEQNVEAVQLPDLQFGNTVTHLRFNDVDLFPLVCADMLQPMAQHPDSAQARIRQVLQGIGDVARPAMVIGSLLQHGYNVNWEMAVDSFLNQVMADRPALVTLCNVAHDHPLANEDQDRWRSLTGVYGKWGELTKGQENLPVGRRLNVRGVVGAVVRRSGPVVSSGTVDWGPYGPVDGKFIWHAEMHCEAGPAGLVAPISLPPTQHGCELARFARRHPPEAGWSPRLAQGLQLVATHLASGEGPGAPRLLDGMLGGVAQSAVDPDALHEPLIAPAVVTALHGLATIATLEGVQWQSNDGQAGQLRVADAQRNILVWRDPKKTSGQMRSELGAWTLEPGQHPDLVVIGASRFGDLEGGVIEEQRRDDVSLSPPAQLDLGATGVLAAAANDITLASARRNVAAVGLSRLAEIYADYDPAQGDDARTAQLLTDISSFFPQGAAA